MAFWPMQRMPSRWHEVWMMSDDDGLGTISGINRENVENSKVLGAVHTVTPGRYEVTEYRRDGPAHSEEMVTLDEPLDGLVVEEVFEGRYLYNVMVLEETNRGMFLLVPADAIE